jgi:signal peptidase I
MKKFLFVVVGGIIILRRCFFVVTVNGTSMVPTLHSGQQILAMRVWSRHWLKKGQIAIAKPPGNHYPHLVIKRIVGLSGDRVEFEREIFHRELNASPQVEHHVTVVQPGYVFLKSDGYGADSRHWGAIPAKNVVGIMLFSLKNGHELTHLGLPTVTPRIELHEVYQEHK